MVRMTFWRVLRQMQSVFLLAILVAVSTGSARASEPEEPSGDAAAVHNAVRPGRVMVRGIGATWISIATPFTWDSNQNSYTTYAYSRCDTGPWIEACGNGIPGSSDWRICAFGSLTPSTTYFVLVTFVDPDGVIGPNQQIVGPIMTNPVSIIAATVGRATAAVRDTNILVYVPIGDDSNMNSSVSNVSVATSPDGPWTQKCYNGGLISPALCEVHGLTRNTDYWIQVNVSDPDGVNGINPQVIGPVHYTGLTDLALNKNITADPGWGCCPNPDELVDGVIQYPAWYYGFAWTGGTGDWGGGSPGFKQALIDLGTPTVVNRLDWWPHDGQSIPATSLVSVSTDGINFTDVTATITGNCRTPNEELDTGWYFASCSQRASFKPVRARWVRYWFDDYSEFDVNGGCPNGLEVCGIHGWATEIEVFGPEQ